MPGRSGLGATGRAGARPTRLVVRAIRLTVGIGWLIGLPVLAETRRVPDERPEQGSVFPLETVQVTATRREAASLDVSSGVTVVGAAGLAAHTPRTIADHLHGEPGTYVQQTTPGQGIPIIRGLKGSEVLHLVDGFRLNNALFRNAPNQYVALVNPWNLERIEVVRGPLSTLYGGDAMGGVVQFFTRSPTFDGTELQSRGKVGVQMATADSSVSTQIEGEAGNGAWVAHSGVTWQDADELRVGRGERLPFTGFRSFGAHAKLRFEPGEDQTVIVQAHTMKQPKTPRYDALVPGFGQLHPDSSELFFKPQERRFGQIRWIVERAMLLADSVDLQLGYQRVIDDRISRDFESPDRELERNSSVLVGMVGNLARRLDEKHLLSYGVEAYRDRVNSSRIRENVDSGATSIRPSRFPHESTMEWIGLYMADEWEAHERFRISAGVRFTGYDIESAPTVNNFGVDMDPHDFSGNLGFVFRASQHLRIVANAGQGFRPPNIFDLGTFGARGNRFNIPNPALRPETILTYDFGFKFADESLRAEVMAFHSRYRDKITQVLTGEVDSDNRFIVQSRNATTLELSGIETGALWHLTTRTSVYSTATWTHGKEEFESEHYAADRIPPVFGKVVFRYLAGSHWTVESTFNWASRQDRLSPRDQVDPRIDPNGTAGWNTLGLRATWRPSDHLDIAVGVDNLTDRRYREHGSGFDASGRSAIASVAWEF